MNSKSKTANSLSLDHTLHYLSGKESGYHRIAENGKFCYQINKKSITNPTIIKRIEALVIPPAWTDVWICKWKNGHIQATGIDAKGRKQYPYHPDWSTTRNLKKFDRIEGFVKKLDRLHNQLSKDIRKKQFVKDKVCAISIDTMNKTFIRAGNKYYEKEYGSFGLTTLKNSHVSIEHNQVFFKFKGKKGVMQKIYLKESKTAKLLSNVKEIPEQKLFQYYDENGTIQQLESGDINSYLKEVLQDDYTCKDFRTWAGCALALMLMAKETHPETLTERKKLLVGIIDQVAVRLGNTRTVTRNYYIHPALQLQFVDGQLQPLLSKLSKKQEFDQPCPYSEKALASFFKIFTNS